ncbi:MAG: hypothetical protein JO061_00630, partial [Acidobacteriaceae bacterium]|nr:hypothetical protein [Acidobacteriaceae bacterium]
GADTILSIDPQKREALFVRWQSGLGRAAVFASDAKSRWADSWVSWSGYDRFWINVARDLVRPTDAADAQAQFDEARGALHVRYRLGEESRQRAPQLYVFGPNGFEKPLRTEQTAHDIFEGELPVPNLPGLWVVKPRAESDVFPEQGLMRYPQESSDSGVNEFLLREISAFTGGRFDPTPAQVFADDGRFTYTTCKIWPGLLLAALILSLAELIARKRPAVSWPRLESIRFPSFGRRAA